MAREIYHIARCLQYSYQIYRDDTYHYGDNNKSHIRRASEPLLR